MNDSLISLESIKGGLFGQKRGKNKHKSKSQNLNESRLNEVALSETTELSFDNKSPGLLKIYGSKIKNKHAHKYKTVLASPTSSAKELLKEALDRYSLPKRSYTEYVLCEVVGVLESVSPEEHQNNCELIGDHKWVEKVCRPLHDNDRPMLFQELWKPESGFCRRLELRLKSDIFKTYKDTHTRLMNRNARRIQKTRAKLGLQGISEELEDSPESPEEAITPTSSFSSKSPNSSQHNSNSLTSSEQQETESGDGGFYKKSVPPPTDCPFLLLLRGHSFRDDSIIYYLSEQITQIGSAEFTASNNNVNERTEIILSADDIKQQHCWIVKKTRSADKISENSRRMSTVQNELMVSIHPLAGAIVSLNGSPLTQPADLKTGDLIQLGQRYLFLYKDLTDFTDLPRDLYWLKPATDWDYESNIGKRNSKGAMEKKELECSINGIPCLNYQKQHETEILHYILNMNKFDDLASFNLAPCYLVCCMIDFCSDIYGKGECKKMVYKSTIAFNDYSREACEKLNLYEHSDRKPTKQSIFDLCELLKPVAYIMANSLEYMNCLDEKKSLYNPIGSAEISQAATTEERVMLDCSDDQLLQILDEIAMETFQECVYQLTKALSFILPTLLSSNPFPSTNDSCTNRMPPSVQSVLDLLQGTLDTFSQMLVHPEVVDQLFGCLLFFMNSFLFNQLMDRGSSGTYFTWSRGVQIRGNLDALESWLYQHGLQKVGNDFLGQLNAVVDLLAWLKVHLIQTDWRRLRNSFPQLSAGQLHYVLQHYCLENKQYPAIWVPTEEDRIAAETEPFYESMDGAPPFKFPLEGFIIKPNLEVPDESISEMLSEIAQKFPPNAPQRKSSSYSNSLRPKESRRQQRSQNTPLLTRMYSWADGYNGSSISRPNKQSPGDDYNYIMSNATPNIPRNYSNVEKRTDSTNKFESPALSSSETLLRSSGTLKSGELNFQPQKAINLPVMGIQSKYKSNQQRNLQSNEILLNTETSAAFAGSSQNSVRKQKTSDTQYGSNIETRIRPIAKPSAMTKTSEVKRRGESSTFQSNSFVISTDYSQVNPGVVSSGNSRGNVTCPTSAAATEFTISSSMSQRQTPIGRKLMASKEHADDALSMNCDSSPRSGPLSHNLSERRGSNERQFRLRQSSSSAFVEINSTLPLQPAAPQTRDNCAVNSVQNDAYQNQIDMANKTFHAIDVADTQSVGGCSTTMSEDREIAWFMDNPVDYSVEDEYTNEIDEDIATLQDDVTTIPDDASRTASAMIFDGDEEQDYLVMVELTKIDNSLGIGLVNGYNMPMKCKGVYIRTMTENGAAKRDGRLAIGDRIMSVDNVTIAEMEYQDAMKIVSNTGTKVKLVVSKCTPWFSSNNVASLC